MNQYKQLCKDQKADRDKFKAMTREQQLSEEGLQILDLLTNREKKLKELDAAVGIYHGPGGNYRSSFIG